MACLTPLLLQWTRLFVAPFITGLATAGAGWAIGYLYTRYRDDELKSSISRMLKDVTVCYSIDASGRFAHLVFDNKLDIEVRIRSVHLAFVDEVREVK